MRKMISAAVAATLLAGSGQAATLLFSFTPTTSSVGPFSFNIDSNPAVFNVKNGYYFETTVSNGMGSAQGVSNLFFYSTPDLGGLTEDVNGPIYFEGPQLYSGSESSPTLLTGTFTLLDESNRAGTLTVAAAPLSAAEATTWTMMIAGFGAVGAAMRRRRVFVRFS